MKLPFFLLILLIACTSCTPKSDPPQEVHSVDGLKKYYREDGRLKSEVHYNEEGMKHGLARNYYVTTGKLQFEIEYNQGAKHGWTRTYYEDGESLYKETQYVDGLKNGKENLYYENGQLQASMEYKEGQLGMGLKEYKEDGQEKGKTDPKIRVKEKNTLAMNNQYLLEFTLDPKTKRVEFFQGELTEGKYWNDYMDPIPTSNGVGRLEIYLPKGSYTMKELKIVAKVKTRLRNYRLFTMDYNLAIDNKAL